MEKREEDPAARTVVWVGDVPIGGDEFAVLAGPCAVESEAQISRSAEALKALGGRILRGGAWKPRTSARDFQGHGGEALRWLARAGHDRGLAVVTEVLSQRDVALAAEHCDGLWIGARNCQNFALLEEVARTGRPVLLKRGVAMTLREWLGAAERVLSVHDRLVLVERGLRHFDSSPRYALDLTAASMLRTMTGAPVLADPSHAAGRRDLVEPLALAAVAAGFDGLMIETHEAPELALSDAAQQLDHQQFGALLARVARVAEAVSRTTSCAPHARAA